MRESISRPSRNSAHPPVCWQMRSEIRILHKDCGILMTATACDGDRASWLPAKHCFVCWCGAYAHKKSRNGKGLMVASSQVTFTRKTFLTAWHSVNVHCGNVEDWARYLRLKCHANIFLRWRLAVDLLLWRKLLHQRLLSVIRSWARIDYWGAWKGRWVLGILVRDQRKRYHHGNGSDTNFSQPALVLLCFCGNTCVRNLLASLKPNCHRTSAKRACTIF